MRLVMSLISSLSTRPHAFIRNTGSGFEARRSAVARFGFGRMKCIAQASEKLRRVSRLSESLSFHLIACRLTSLHALGAALLLFGDNLRKTAG
jgi:hypothetical protein